MNKNILYAALIAVLVGGAGFAGGMKYQSLRLRKSFQNNMGNRRNMMDGNGGNFGNFGGNPMGAKNENMMGGQQGLRGKGFRPVVGEIISKDEKSITVKMNDGSSAIVMFGDSTDINKSQDAAAGDLIVGTTVRVFGTSNTDGSVTAENIQINPEMPNAQNLQNTTPNATPTPTE